ncbi:50S ribosomal protein L3 [Bradyrhizobium sp. CNPSo 4016]|nr:50S ribosomal protein L3 [Bradyrhizobium glycinis]
MRTGVLAQKEGMSHVYDDDGKRLPVTILRVPNCQVLGHRTLERHGYLALEVGAGSRKIARMPKAERGKFAVAQVEPKRRCAEFRVTENGFIPVGAEITVDHFAVGQFVDVTGTTKGKGFAGGMKRHNFAGLRATHGVSISHRSIGSTGGRQDPGKTWKNKRMPGHMGGDRVTAQNLRIVEIDTLHGVIKVCGAVPGPNDAWIQVRDAVKKPLPKEIPIPGRFIEPNLNHSVLSSDTLGEAENDLLRAFVDLEEGDVSTRLAAVRMMLARASDARWQSSEKRRTWKRVRAIEKALVDALFDDAPDVRWAAAYAIATLKDKDHKLNQSRIPDYGNGKNDEPRVRRILEAYFKEAEVDLLTGLSIDVAQRSKNAIKLKLEAQITRQLPVVLDGKHILTGSDDSLKVGNIVTVTISDAIGSLHKTIRTRVEKAESVTAIALIEVPPAKDNEIYVDFRIGGRSLDTLSATLESIMERHGIPLHPSR